MFNHLLTVFVCAADCGSFNKAAEKLYLSAPSVMKQVNALEKQLDMKLFHRTNQGLHLTPAGQVIYRHAKYLFSYSRNAIAEARAAASLSEKTFCIGSSLLNPCKPFMDLWYKVNASFPGYRLHIVPFEDDHQGILTLSLTRSVPDHFCSDPDLTHSLIRLRKILQPHIHRPRPVSLLYS